MSTQGWVGKFNNQGCLFPASRPEPRGLGSRLLCSRMNRARALEPWEMSSAIRLGKRAEFRSGHGRGGVAQTHVFWVHGLAEPGGLRSSAPHTRTLGSTRHAPETVGTLRPNPACPARSQVPT